MELRDRIWTSAVMNITSVAIPNDRPQHQNIPNIPAIASAGPA